MTALYTRPLDADDHRWLLRALSLALAIHILALLLPLSLGESAPLAAAPQPASEPLVLRRLTLPPPPPRPTILRPKATSPRLPMIEVDSSVLTPRVSEPSVDVEIPFDPNAAEVELAYEPQAPVSLPRLLDEHTPGLTAPVAFEDRAQPVYPRIAIVSRLEGRVVLRAIINAEGRVESIEILSRPAAGVGFAEAAVEAVSGWEYTPGTYRGRPVAVSLTVVVDFVMR